MAWRIVQQPNGLLARFIDNIADFTDYDMSKAEAIECCSGYAGRAEALGEVQRGIDAGLTRFDEAIRKIGVAHGKRRARERRRALSVPIDKDGTNHAGRNTVTTYRRKQQTVEAVQFDPRVLPWPDYIKPYSSVLPPELNHMGYIDIGDADVGIIPVSPGEWVVTEEDGNRTVWSDKVFMSCFEKAEP